MEKTKSYRPVPGLSREEEEKQLAGILDVAQENLKRTEGYIKGLSDELYDLMETYGPKDKEALSLLHNTQSQLREYFLKPKVSLPQAITPSTRASTSVSSILPNTSTSSSYRVSPH